MTTEQLIASLKELDPTGKNRIALLHRDEYCSNICLTLDSYIIFPYKKRIKGYTSC